MSAEKNEHEDDAMEQDQGDSSSSDDSDDDEPHPDAYTGNEQVTVDFEGRPPTDPDRFGISQLLERVYLRAHINCTQLAELIIAQNFVGSVICQCESDGPESDTDDGDEDMLDEGTIFGITTVLNITAKKDKPGVEQLRAYILERAAKNANAEVNAFFRSVLDSDEQSVGYLINERFINIPAQISVPLLENLHKEITDAKAKKMKFDFTYLLMIIKLYRKESKKGKPAEDTYTNAEEELIVERAKHSFEFSTANESDTGLSGNWLENDAQLTPYRKIVLFEAKQLPQLIKDIKDLVNGE